MKKFFFPLIALIIIVVFGYVRSKKDFDVEDISSQKTRKVAIPKDKIQKIETHGKEKY